jgi:putative FmdB family regulatory protein
MPTYDYRCPACGHEFEKFEKMNATSRARCPSCGKRAERVISGGAGLLFKGSGFYITDYKRAGQPKPSEGGEKTGKPEKSEKTDKSSHKKSPKSAGAE